MTATFPPPIPVPAPVQSYGNPSPTIEYVKFWRRILARAGDSMLAGLCALPFNVASGIASALSVRNCSGETYDGQIACRPNEMSSGLMIAAIVLQVAALVFGVYLYAAWVGRRGGGPAARRLGVYVVDEVTGEFIGRKRAVGRYFASLLSAIVIYIGYISSLWHPRRQTWHDRMAHTVVVRRS